MSRKPSSILVLVLLSLGVGTAAGCGGSSSNSAATTQAATTTTAAATTAATTTTATATNATSALSGIATAANCSQLAGLGASFAQALTGTGTTDIQKTAALLKEFADRTPSDIRAQFQLLAAAYVKIADALKGVNLASGKAPSAAEIQKLQSLSSGIDQAALAKAATAIGVWAQKNCTHP